MEQEKLIMIAFENSISAKVAVKAMQKVLLTPEQFEAYKEAYFAIASEEFEQLNSQLGLKLSVERLQSLFETSR